MDIWTIVAILVAVGYILFYLRGKLYFREPFEDKKERCTTVLDTSYQTRPYVTNEDKYGDFEQDFIYRNEGGFDPTRDAIDAARRRFPFDWAQLPPSSSLFQAQQALFVKDGATKAAPFVGETFSDLEAVKAAPEAPKPVQITEEDLLKAYKPLAAGDMKAVDEQSVEKMIESIYGAKGLVAKVAKKANNVFEIYEVQEKDPKIVWEDEVNAKTSIQDNALNPLPDQDMLVVPPGVGDVSAGVAPYGRGESTALTRRKYDDYNPNLEGIFGPRMQWQQWG